MTENERLLRALRSAADPGMEPGAAGRIADGAWERAAVLRASAPRFRGLRRTGWAAAAAVLAAVAVFALRCTEPAFAVEGDPVRVQRGGVWVETRRVGVGSVVEVPEGSRVLRYATGGTLRPQPGSLFHFVRAGGESRTLRVEFERGGGDVSGGAFVVTMHDVVVERDPSSPTLTFSFASGSDRGGSRVEVGSGRAVVRSLASSERVLLDPQESAAMLPVSFEGVQSLRLTKLAAWSPSAEARIADGRFCVVDANLDAKGGVLLVGNDPARRFIAFEVPASHVPEALAGVNRLARMRISIDARVTTSHPARYLYESGATNVEVLVDESGAIGVKTDAGLRHFPDLATFRRAMPDVAALFGDSLR